MGHTAGRMARQQAAHPQAGGRQAAAAACVRAVPRSTVVVLLLALSAWVLTAAHGSRRDSGVADMMDDVGHLEQMYYFCESFFSLRPPCIAAGAQGAVRCSTWCFRPSTTYT